MDPPEGVEGGSLLTDPAMFDSLLESSVMLSLLECNIDPIDLMDMAMVQDPSQLEYSAPGGFCTKSEANEFRQSLDTFEQCAHFDLEEFLQTLPSALLGSSLNCLWTLHADGSPSVECIDALFGHHALGDALRQIIATPQRILNCFHASPFPDCTLKDWPIPIPGPWIESLVCLLDQSDLDLLCDMERVTLNECLDEDDLCASDCSDSMLLALPDPLLGMPMPPFCAEGDHVLARRYEKYVTECLTEEQGTLWEPVLAPRASGGEAEYPASDMVLSVHTERDEESSSGGITPVGIVIGMLFGGVLVGLLSMLLTRRRNRGIKPYEHVHELELSTAMTLQ